MIINNISRSAENREVMSRVTRSNNLIKLQFRQLEVEMRWEAGPEQENLSFLWKNRAEFISAKCDVNQEENSSCCSF